MPDRAAQEVKPLRQVDDTRLFLREGKAAFGQPRWQELVPDTDSVLLTFAEHHKVVRIPNNGSLSSDLTLTVMANPQGRFHAVQGDVQEQRTNHATLGCSPLGRVKRAIFHDPGLEPLSDEFPTGKVAEGG